MSCATVSGTRCCFGASADEAPLIRRAIGAQTTQRHRQVARHRLLASACHDEAVACKPKGHVTWAGFPNAACTRQAGSPQHPGGKVHAGLDKASVPAPSCSTECLPWGAQCGSRALDLAAMSPGSMHIRCPHVTRYYFHLRGHSKPKPSPSGADQRTTLATSASPTPGSPKATSGQAPEPNLVTIL